MLVVLGCLGLSHLPGLLCPAKPRGCGAGCLPLLAVVSSWCVVPVLRDAGAAGAGEAAAPLPGCGGAMGIPWGACGGGCTGKRSSCDQGCVRSSTSAAVTEEMVASPLLLLPLLLIAIILLSSSDMKHRSQTKAAPDPACAAAAPSGSRRSGGAGPGSHVCRVLAEMRFFRSACKHPVPGVGVLAVLSLHCAELLPSVTHLSTTIIISQ